MPTDLMQTSNACLEALAKFRLLAVLGEQSGIDFASFVPLAGLFVFPRFLPARIGRRNARGDCRNDCDDDGPLGGPIPHPRHEMPPGEYERPASRWRERAIHLKHYTDTMPIASNASGGGTLSPWTRIVSSTRRSIHLDETRRALDSRFESDHYRPISNPGPWQTVPITPPAPRLLLAGRYWRQ